MHSGHIYLLSGRIVDVEVDLSRGLHSFSVIGLPDKAVEEARDRISAAIKNSGFESPKHKNQKVVISLAPAYLRKEGSCFDLAMALGYLVAAGDICFDATDKLFIGELSLDGELRGTAGILPIVIEARQKGFREIFLPVSHVGEAELVSGVKIFGVQTLTDVVRRLDLKSAREKTAGRVGRARSKQSEQSKSESKSEQERQEQTRQLRQPEQKERTEQAKQAERSPKNPSEEISLAEIKGQETAKRGLMIAAAGAHNILMYGPPGTGKTMLAKAFRALLPPLSPDQVLEVTSIHSIAGTLSGAAIFVPPFRSPHHTSSHISLIGGGSIPRPGEITLAHRGVLFLDEFPEFDRRVIETLRQPLEERFITVSRAKGSARFPANVILIATMNPCPCGHFGSSAKRCACKPNDVARYRRKISGPVADRIDLWVEVGAIQYESLKISREGVHGKSQEELTKKDAEITALKEKIRAARALQTERFEKFKKGSGMADASAERTNSDILGKDLPALAPLSTKTELALIGAAKSLSLSVRAYHRVWKIARTIADLAGEKEIKEPHILEALQYRPPKGPEEDLN